MCCRGSRARWPTSSIDARKAATMTPLSRRELLSRAGVGMGMIGLAQVMGDAGLLAADIGIDPTKPLASRQPHFPAKAKRVIHIFANGGPSQVDTFDPKPMLDKY